MASNVDNRGRAWLRNLQKRMHTYRYGRQRGWHRFVAQSIFVSFHSCTDASDPCETLAVRNVLHVVALFLPWAIL